MTKRDKIIISGFIVRTAMYVWPVNESNIIGFIHGYETGRNRKCGLTELLRKHFEEKLDTKYSSDGWWGQISRYSERRSKSWVTVFKQEALEIILSEENGGMIKEVQKNLRTRVSSLIERINENGYPCFDDWWLEEWNTLCLVKKSWFRNLWTDKEFKAIRAIEKEIDNNEAFRNSQPLKATKELLKQKTLFFQLPEKGESKKKVAEKLKPMKIEEFNTIIDRALDDAKNGRVVTTKELKEEMKSWGKTPSANSLPNDID